MPNECKAPGFKTEVQDPKGRDSTTGSLRYHKCSLCDYEWFGLSNEGATLHCPMPRCNGLAPGTWVDPYVCLRRLNKPKPIDGEDTVPC